MGDADHCLPAIGDTDEFGTGLVLQSSLRVEVTVTRGLVLAARFRRADQETVRSRERKGRKTIFLTDCAERFLQASHTPWIDPLRRPRGRDGGRLSNNSRFSGLRNAGGVCGLLPGECLQDLRKEVQNTGET